MVTLQLASKLQLTVDETPFSLDDLARAEEVFITGTTVEIMPVVQIDGMPVSAGTPGTVTRRLQQAFEERIQHLPQKTDGT